MKRVYQTVVTSRSLIKFLIYCKRGVRRKQGALGLQTALIFI